MYFSKLLPNITIVVPSVQVTPIKIPQYLSEKLSETIFTVLMNAGAAPIPIKIRPH